MTRVAVVYHSQDGHTKILADAIAFGSPTHMGSVSGPFKAFLDGTLHRWYARAWLDKVGAAIARPESISGFGFRRLRSSVPGYGDRQETA